MRKQQTSAAARPTPADVENIRTKIAAKRAERDEMVDAPPSRVELAERMDRTLAMAVAAAERRIASRISSMDYSAETLLSARAQGNSDRVDLLPTMIAVLGVDAVRKGLSRFIAEAEDGPTPAERTARLHAIDAQLLALEQAEERAIRALEAEGVDIVRRGDASPAVVLADL